MTKIKPFYDGKTGLFGFVDDSGTEIIPPKYLWADDFREGRASVQSAENRLFGFVDENGTEIVPPKYWSVSEFFGGRAKFQSAENGHDGMIDLDGTEVVPPKYDLRRDFARLRFEKTGQFLYVDEFGNEIWEENND